MSQIQEYENKEIEQLIVQLLKEGKAELAQLNLKTYSEGDKLKIQILNMICKAKEEEKEIQCINIINPGLDGILQQNIFLFFYNFSKFPLDKLIVNIDTLSNFYFTIKKEKQFADFLKEKQKKYIPFFTMMEFIAKLNVYRDISKDIEKFMKKKYIQQLINQYIERKRASLWKILFIYTSKILKGYEESEISNEDIIKLNNNSLDELKAMFQQYMCFNDIYDQGELVYFMNTLYSAITENLNSIHLKEGPEKECVNDLINLILRDIIEQFNLKYYFNKKKINQIFDSISDRIKDFVELTVENNYAKFVTTFSRYFNQGNKNLVLSFFAGLNPNNFEATFKKVIRAYDNNNNDYYNNINYYLNEIYLQKGNKPKETETKNVEEKNEKNLFEENNIINVNDNNKKEKNDEFTNNNNKEVKYNNSKDLEEKSSNNNLLYENKIESKEEIESTIKSDNDKKEDIKSNSYLLKEIEELKKENRKINKKVDEINKKCENLEKVKKKIINLNLETKKEISKLKHQMKLINYRDISKNIINNYLNKYNNRIPKDIQNQKKKEKANYISKYLKGDERNYYQKIIDKYYDANYKSHISVVFNEYEKNMIVGSKFEKTSIVDKVFEDYCLNIFDTHEKANEIDNLFKIKEIVGNLYKEIVLNSRYS